MGEARDDARRRAGAGGYARGRARKEEILRHALEVFAARGYRGSSMAAIAEQAGLTEPGLLHHFRNKSELLLRLLELRAEDVRTEYERLLDDAEPGLGREHLLEWLTATLVPNERTPHIGQLFLTLAAESTEPAHPAHSWFVGRYQELRSRLAALLAKSLGAAPERADDLATRLIATADGLQLQWLLAPDTLDLRSRFRAAAEELLPDGAGEAATP